MRNKICNKCKILKKITEFAIKRANKDRRMTTCRQCRKIYDSMNYYKHREEKLKRKMDYRRKNPQKIKEIYKTYRERYPWKSHYYAARGRCNRPNDISYKYYGKRGIKFLMTVDNFKYIWFRDKAYLLKRPSIDRINNDKNYVIKNCRFIELSKNISEGNKLRY